MYEYKGRIRYSECDREGKLSISGLIGYLQDVATFHSEDAGVGLFFLKEKSMGWVVTNYTMKLGAMPKMGEHITIRTYPHDMKGCVAYRSYEIMNETGERFAAVVSTWALMSLESFRPLRITEEVTSAYGDMVVPEFSPESVKVKIIEEQQLIGQFEVTEGEIDTNNHMNNGAYAELAAKFLPEGQNLSNCVFSYKKMLFLGDKAEVYKAKDENGVLQIIFKCRGEVNFIAQI